MKKIKQLAVLGIASLMAVTSGCVDTGAIYEEADITKEETREYLADIYNNSIKELRNKRFSFHFTSASRVKTVFATSYEYVDQTMVIDLDVNFPDKAARLVIETNDDNLTTHASRKTKEEYYFSVNGSNEVEAMFFRDGAIQKGLKFETKASGDLGLCICMASAITEIARVPFFDGYLGIILEDGPQYVALQDPKDEPEIVSSSLEVAKNKPGCTKYKYQIKADNDFETSGKNQYTYEYKFEFVDYLILSMDMGGAIKQHINDDGIVDIESSFSGTINLLPKFQTYNVPSLL